MHSIRNRKALTWLFPRTRAAVLTALLVGDRELHGREVARRVGMAPRSVMLELQMLVREGVVTARRSGNRVYYSANKRCPVYPELRMLLIKTVGVADEIQKAMKPLKEMVDFAYVYGSFASGEARADSDIDLMVVGRATLKQLGAALAKAEDALSREVHATVYSKREYAARLRERDGFVAQVHSGPRITVLGDPDELV